MQISSVTRGTGRRATAAAAYRSGERIRDERTGASFNHVRRRDIQHTEVFLPAQFDGEPLRISPGTNVEITIADRPFYALSMRLSDR